MDTGQYHHAIPARVDHALQPPLLSLEERERRVEPAEGLTTPVDAILWPFGRHHVFDVRVVEIKPPILVAVERSVHLPHELHVLVQHRLRL
jgi:hypothetical protein